MGTLHTHSKPAGDTAVEGAVNKLKGRATIQRCLDKLETQGGKNIMDFKGKCKVLLLGQSNPVPQDSLGPLPRRQLCRNGPGGQEGGSVAAACPSGEGQLRASCVRRQCGEGTDPSLPRHSWDPTRTPCPVQAARDTSWPERGPALCGEAGRGGPCSRGHGDGRGIPPRGDAGRTGPDPSRRSRTGEYRDTIKRETAPSGSGEAGSAGTVGRAGAAARCRYLPTIST